MTTPTSVKSAKKEDEKNLGDVTDGPGKWEIMAALFCRPPVHYVRFTVKVPMENGQMVHHHDAIIISAEICPESGRSYFDNETGEKWFISFKVTKPGSNVAGDSYRILYSTRTRKGKILRFSVDAWQ